MVFKDEVQNMNEQSNIKAGVKSDLENFLSANKTRIDTFAGKWKEKKGFKESGVRYVLQNSFLVTKNPEKAFDDADRTLKRLSGAGELEDLIKKIFAAPEGLMLAVKEGLRQAPKA